MPVELSELLDDFAAERAAMCRVLEGLDEAAWDRPSPAEGWLLRDCVAHLAEFDERANTVVREGVFPAESPRQPAGGAPKERGPHTPSQLWAREQEPAAVLAWWQDAGDRLIAGLREMRGDERLPWAGPPMSARSFTTARLMEHWSHGLDIHDAAGVAPVDTDRLRHIAHLGYITREFAYRNRGLEPPDAPLYVELEAPSGATWRWGPSDAANRISGAAGEFCRVVTQRIHPADTALRAEGEAAHEFLFVAQAFAGPPGSGRPPKGG